MLYSPVKRKPELNPPPPVPEWAWDMVPDGDGGGGMAMAHTTTTYTDYVVGTLFINMVDASKEQLVWQGRAEKTLNEDTKPEKREKNINDAVQKVFYKYPPKIKK